MSKVKKVTESPTIDVCLVTIKTKDGSIYGIDTANKLGVEVQTEDTDAVKLVIKNKLKAQKKEKKTVTGNKLTMTDNVFSPEVALILQGGQILYSDKYEYTATDAVEAGKYYIEVDDMFLSILLEDALVSGDKILYNSGTGIAQVIPNSGSAYRIEIHLDYDKEEDATKLTTTKTSDNTTIKGYRPPVTGSGDEGEEFETICYSAQYDASGNIVRYEKITYPNCKGTPIALNTEDDAFRAPEYEINSSPSTGQAPYNLDYVPNLPKVI